MSRGGHEQIILNESYYISWNVAVEMGVPAPILVSIEEAWTGDNSKASAALTVDQARRFRHAIDKAVGFVADRDLQMAERLARVETEIKGMLATTEAIAEMAQKIPDVSMESMFVSRVAKELHERMSKLLETVVQ